MFSKQILKRDLEYLEQLKMQRIACAKLITKTLHDLLKNDNIKSKELENEKETIYGLNGKLHEINEDIHTLEEQMFLNYTNKFCITSSRPSPPGFTFPHIDTIIS